MPWIRNQGGRTHFVSDNHYKKMIGNGDKIEIVSDPTLIKDPRDVDPRTTEGEQNIVKLRAEFEKKHGEPVPNNMKNNATWIASKL